MLKTLSYYDNNKLKAAEALGISAKTIYNRLSRYQDGEGSESPAGARGEGKDHPGS